MVNSNASARRQDVEGLRGVALTLVVLFHIWMGTVSGGVDIFLALSGFFLIGSLGRSISSGKAIQLKARLSRIFKRLVPPMAIVSAAVGVLTALFLPKVQWQPVFDQILASLLFWENWHLIGADAGYNAASSTVSPVQHLWSMSVQGQVFVLCIVAAVVLAFLLNRWAPRTWSRLWIVVGLVAAGAIASFVYAAMLNAADPVNAYYNTFARGWEFLLPGLIALLLPHLTLPRLVREILAYVGLLVVCLCGFIIRDGSTAYPGPLALIPVLAAMAVVVSSFTRPDGEEPGRVSKALSSAPLVWLAGISYSLYLWHWPLLVFHLYQSGESHAGFWTGLQLILLSITLAWLTTLLVDKPIRERVPHWWSLPAGRFGRASIAHMSVVVAVIACLVVPLVWSAHVSDEERVPAQVASADHTKYPGAAELLRGAHTPSGVDPIPNVYQAEKDKASTSSNGCFNEYEGTNTKPCVYGNPQGSRTVAIVGSSHAEQWVDVISDIAKRHDIKLLVYTKGGCNITTDPHPKTLDGKDYPGCRVWMDTVLSEVKQLKPAFVFTTNTRTAGYGNKDYVPDDYISGMRILTDAGIPILGLRDNPWLMLPGSAPKIPTECLPTHDAVECGMPRVMVLNSENPAISKYADNPLMHNLDLTSGLCDAVNCKAIVGNVQVYRDSHHLTQVYARTLSEELERQLGNATGWW